MLTGQDLIDGISGSSIGTTTTTPVARQQPRSCLRGDGFCASATGNQGSYCKYWSDGGQFLHVSICVCAYRALWFQSVRLGLCNPFRCVPGQHHRMRLWGRRALAIQLPSDHRGRTQAPCIHSLSMYLHLSLCRQCCSIPLLAPCLQVRLLPVRAACLRLVLPGGNEAHAVELHGLAAVLWPAPS